MFPRTVWGVSPISRHFGADLPKYFVFLSPVFPSWITLSVRSDFIVFLVAPSSTVRGVPFAGAAREGEVRNLGGRDVVFPPVS